MKKITISIAAFVVGCILSGCHGYSITGGPGKNASQSLQAQSDKSGELLTINSLFVSNVEIAEEIRSRTHLNFDFSSQLHQAVNDELGMRVYFDELDKPNLKSLPTHQDSDALSKARKVNADGILFTKVTNFIEREGSAVGSDRPAQVDFSMSVVRISDNKTVWQSTYHFKDQPLSENLFKIKDRLAKESRLQFRTADELIRSGYRSALGDLSKQRLSQFSTKR